ncbi:NAD(P)/FAD-dependent oxidoreductase [Arthrobacter sp. Leaf137]|uniref:FAD-dependent oxidoreductase n=1 Tax=Arthrobacter sp. Leaf137 TaxID=1736271 RepID=UPI0006F9C93A|nr:NAD(P)/FAD-dependent oxidoreductase [Arthrobacter sp. Leaf137]KQQ85307.1 FAD-binding monooxygenase [Arthrobacter sp. Leaf137]
MNADVVIVGGGPVGLYLAAVLLRQGITVRVLEQRSARNHHSRAIGIHPPALAALDQLGIARRMVAEGVPILSGLAVSRGRTVGRMPFAGVSEAFPFVLSLPQYRTEQLLEEQVHALDSCALVRGMEVREVAYDGGSASVSATPAGGAAQGSSTFRASIVVGADGPRSTVRDLLGVPVRRKTYPDHYLMGDFADHPEFGDRAVLFLESAGIVESFPLPGAVRRWVVRLGQPAGGATPEELARLVADRTGIHPVPATNTMLSAFSVRSSVARRTVAGRVILVGDAAHEISPIGGQGMNLGWLDAHALAPLIVQTVTGRHAPEAFRDYERGRSRAALRARRQAEINMLLGRPLPARVLALRNTVIGAAAASPAINQWVAGRFTMQQEFDATGLSGSSSRSCPG